MKNTHITVDPLREIFMQLDDLQRQVDELNKRQDEKNAPPKSQDMIRVPAAAVFLGLSESRVYQLCSEGKIPYDKKGGNYFWITELTKWVKDGRVINVSAHQRVADKLLNKKAVSNG